MHPRLPKHQIVLLGIGHTNAHVLRMWKMQPIKDAGLVCVSNAFYSTYSGMMPGVLAGQYPSERMQIDLARLCSSAGARLIVGEVTGLEPAKQQLVFADRPALPFDVLSVGIGSIPSRGNIQFDDEAPVLSIKPMQTFLSRLAERISAVEATADRPLHVVVVGGGVGGVEICFCLPNYLQKQMTEPHYQISLIDGGGAIPKGAASRTSQIAQAQLESRGVQLHLKQRVARVSADRVHLVSGDKLDADIVLWATGAVAPALLNKFGLPLDERGFLRTDHTLRTTAGHPVFAVGDTGTIDDEHLAKAGVYAVRQGPVLLDNIENLLLSQPLENYRPQRRFLKLLNTADGQAIAEYGSRAFRGRWAWRLKDFIDSRFMDKYQDYSLAMMAPEEPDLEAELQMRCAGCGGKIGSTVLSQVLKRLDTESSINNENVLIGLNQPDDVAVVRSSGDQLAVTTDFFSAPVDDPYTTGRMAALNSISDIYAAGATPTAALAMVTIPHGDRQVQEQLLFELLDGSLRVLREHDIALVGGHTIEGAQLTLGFTVLGHPNADAINAKADLNVGDQLILTKPLGSGILLAAQMQALCRGEWLESLLNVVVTSNRDAATVFQDNGVSALTDVTGFGLAGHLLEMLKSSAVAAELTLKDVSLLPGVAELISEGIESTLSPANRDAEQEIKVSEPNRRTPEYAALFDPQTCGGLLAGVANADVANALAAFQDAGIDAAVIGQVTACDPNQRRITLV